MDELSEEFRANQAKFVQEFDEMIEESLFLGPELEALSRRFLDQNATSISATKFTVRTEYPNCKNQKTLDEDFELISCDVSKLPRASQQATLVAEVFWRAAQACYLRVTFNKCRFDQEDDRAEAVGLSRLALRFDPLNFKSNFWYMICSGWLLDSITNAKEKTMLSRVFKQSTLRCIELNPEDPLAHHLLGRYYYNVAKLTWIERTLASKLLGCKLEGTFEDSEREFMIAHEMKNDWMPTGLWLARVCVAQQRPRDEIKRWIDLGLSLDSNEPSSEIEKAELRALRDKLKL